MLSARGRRDDGRLGERTAATPLVDLDKSWWGLMIRAPRPRRILLTVHIICSVGRIGAAAGGPARPPRTFPSASQNGMELTGWFVIVPMATSALITGVLLAMATPWGLIRHYSWRLLWP
jgi:hypothetical protein